MTYLLGRSKGINTAWKKKKKGGSKVWSDMETNLTMKECCWVRGTAKAHQWAIVGLHTQGCTQTGKGANDLVTWQISGRIGLERSPLSRRIGFKSTIHSGPVFGSPPPCSHQLSASEFTACLQVNFQQRSWAIRCENGSKINRAWILREKRYGKWKGSRCRRGGKSQLREVRSCLLCTARNGQGKCMVGKEEGRNYHVEKPSPSTGIAGVFCSDAIYFPFFETDQHGPEER